MHTFAAFLISCWETTELLNVGCHEEQGVLPQSGGP